MPTRTGGSSANQSLRSELSTGTLNFKKNLDYMIERYGLDKVGPANKDIKDAIDNLDISAKGNIARNPSLFARASQTTIENDMQAAASVADVRTGEPELNKTITKVYRNEEIYEMAQRLAMKVVTETFNTVGGGQEETSPFAIARKRENGVQVDPMQMKQDITGMFMDYAAARESVRRFGLRDAQNEENSTNGLVGATVRRFNTEIRNYGQYGKGEFVDIFDKAFDGFRNLLGKPMREERGD